MKHHVIFALVATVLGVACPQRPMTGRMVQERAVKIWPCDHGLPKRFGRKGCCPLGWQRRIAALGLRSMPSSWWWRHVRVRGCRSSTRSLSLSISSSFYFLSFVLSFSSHSYSLTLSFSLSLSFTVSFWRKDSNFLVVYRFLLFLFLLLLLPPIFSV